MRASWGSDPAALLEKIHYVFSVCFVEIWGVASFNLYALSSQEIVLRKKKNNESVATIGLFRYLKIPT